MVTSNNPGSGTVYPRTDTTGSSGTTVLTNNPHNVDSGITSTPVDTPATGDLGDHPVATGVGAVGGLATGAAVGSAAGPLGTLVGAAVGAVVGGMAGKAVGQQIDPTAEDTYWSQNYASRPYVASGSSYDDYGPAYRYGVDSYRARSGSSFDSVESDLGSGWESARGRSRLTWEQAKNATRDSWQRLSDNVERAIPGDSDRDGK